MTSDMKTTSIHIAGALILTVCLGVSCRKELPALTGSDDPVTVLATISDAADTKVIYTEVGDKLKSAWAAGDHIVGWDDNGHKLELEIASADRITSEGVAIFTPVTGSASLPASGKIYMIYAPGKHYNNIGTNSLTVDLSNQAADVIPALMMATGTVSDRQIKLDFSNEMAIVMVKNPKIANAPSSSFGGLVLSGVNVYTSVTFGMGSNSLTMTPSTPGSITKNGLFMTNSSGEPTSDVTFYFAVPPSSSSAEISIGSFSPDKYAVYSSNRSFVKKKCYKVNAPALGNRAYKINITQPSEGGTFSTAPAGCSPWGGEVAITANPASVYWELVPSSIKVAMVTPGDVGLTSDNKFIMPEHDVTVTGSFRKLQYTLTKASATGGSFILKNTATGSEISSPTNLDWGTNITVVPSPNTGWIVDQVKYNDGSDHTVSLVSSAYKFDMPKKNTTVTVTFKIQVPGTTPEYPITNW